MPIDISIIYKFHSTHDSKTGNQELNKKPLLNSQGVARPVSGRCDFDSIFRPLPLFRITRPKMFIILNFGFQTNIEHKFCP